MRKVNILLYLAAMPCALSAQTADADTLDIWNRDPLGLETIVVTGTRTPKTLKDIPVVTRIITAEEIKKVDATDIKDMLQQELPGAEFTYSMGHQVMNLGGYDGNNILFLIDGERMAGESMDNIDFSRLNLQGVERIEIVKGAASTLYGSSAMGGVVNIITKQPSDTWASNVSSRYEGATKEWRHGANIDFNMGKVNSFTTFQMTDADALTLQGDESSISTAYASKSYHGKERLIFTLSDNLKLTGRAGYFFRERNVSTEKHERYRDLEGGLKANWNITPLQNLEVAYSYDQYDKSDYAVLTDRDVRDYSNRQNIVRALYNLTMPTWKSQLTAGADFMNDYLLSYQFADSQKSHVQNSYDVFAQWDYTPNRHWNLLAGLRYDYFSSAQKGMPTWKLAGMYKTGRHSLRLSYAYAFRAPSLKELYMDFFMGGIFMIYGNPDLNCETNHNLSLTYDHYGSIGSELKYNVTATGYYNYFKNYITTATVQRDGAYGQMYTNIANQKIAGADANIQLRHRLGLGLRLSYAFTKSIVDKGQPDLTAARPHSLTWRLDYDRQICKNYGFRIALSGRYLSDVDVTEYTSTGLSNVTNVHYEGYSIWKLSLSQRIMKWLTINSAIDNLFGYKPKNYYANSPTTTGTTCTIGASIDIDKIF
ncbi:MAG: TonB-dependent receptor plug domain-containing protein [Prevotella sp.]